MKPCYFPACESDARHKHHITYEPEVIFDLCVQHHKDITVVNINRAEKTHRKLSNSERWELWQAWLKGEVKPVLTANASNWVDQMDKPEDEETVKSPREFGGAFRKKHQEACKKFKDRLKLMVPEDAELRRAVLDEFYDVLEDFFVRMIQQFPHLNGRR